MTETVFFEQPTEGLGDVRVTNARVVLGATTYSLANITSVKAVKQEPDTAWCAWLLFGGAGWIALAHAFDLGHQWAGYVAAGIGILGFVFSKPTFHVYLASASGETDALSSNDEGFIGGVVEAINSAIVHRG